MTQHSIYNLISLKARLPNEHRMCQHQIKIH